MYELRALGFGGFAVKGFRAEEYESRDSGFLKMV